MNRSQGNFAIVVPLLAAAFAAMPINAQTRADKYPTKPIRVIVPFAPVAVPT